MLTPCIWVRFYCARGNHMFDVAARDRDEATKIGKRCPHCKSTCVTQHAELATGMTTKPLPMIGQAIPMGCDEADTIRFAMLRTKAKIKQQARRAGRTNAMKAARSRAAAAGAI